MKIENLKITGRQVYYNYDNKDWVLEINNMMLKAANDDYESNNIAKALIRQVKSTIVMYHNLKAKQLPSKKDILIEAQRKRAATLLKKKKSDYLVYMISLNKTVTSLRTFIKYLFVKLFSIE